jgi:hypothetical protein
MFNLRAQIMALAGAVVVVLAVAADDLGVLTGSPHSFSALRVAGFVAIAIGLFYILRRE